jgi:hypothetical protein
MIQSKKSGFIFIYVLLISFLILSLGTYLFNRSVTFPSYVKTNIRNEQAKQLTFSGIEWARALLSVSRLRQDSGGQAAKTSQNNTENKTSKNAEAFDQINLLFPQINQWQHFDLREQNDGVDGTLGVCITNEEGKININSLFDFKNKKFTQEKLVDLLNLKLESFGIKDFKSHLEQFFKKRGSPLTIITELLEDDYFKDAFKDMIFYIPAEDASTSKKKIYLTDLFTTYTTPELKINPWFFSDSISQLFDLTRASLQKMEDRKKHIESLKNEFKTQYNWQSDFKKFLQPMYEKSLEQYISFLKTDVVFNYFSVLCKANFSGNTKKVYAILQKKERAQPDEIMYDVNIIQVYFL